MLHFLFLKLNFNLLKIFIVIMIFHSLFCYIYDLGGEVNNQKYVLSISFNINLFYANCYKSLLSVYRKYVLLNNRCLEYRNHSIKCFE
jgi:hypothetical protein